MSSGTLKSRASSGAQLRVDRFSSSVRWAFE
jgi:hypothetical protein